MNTPQSDQSLDLIIRQTIEEVTGNLIKDIRLESDLVEDLGMTRSELSNMIVKVEQKLELSLSDDAKREILSAEFVEDVVEIVQDEYEF